ncbi:MAG: SpoIIE family protein phosphatase [Spirochaetales bacterium]|jgi:sigma-B regulation protein RsbU (phosphoserine phosphatase)|nr:SpoIIE family protein phosphatase [Spirochaetales bacterium]
MGFWGALLRGFFRRESRIRALAGRLKEARRRSESCLGFGVFLSGFSGRFINLVPEEYDACIYALLRGIGEFSCVDEASLVTFPAVSSGASSGALAEAGLDAAAAPCGPFEVKMWRRGGSGLVTKTGGEFPVVRFRPWRERLSLGEVIYIEDAGALPAVSRAFLEKGGRLARGLLAVPLLREGPGERAREKTLAGFLNFSCAGAKPWAKGEIEFLCETAGALVSLHLRWEAESDMREARSHFTQLVNSVQSAFFLFSEDFSRTIYVSPAYSAIWGKSRESLRDEPLSWLESLYPDERVFVQDAFLRFPSQTESFSTEFRLQLPGGVKWITFRAFRGEGEKERRIAAVAEDITQRKAAEMQLVRLREADLETSARIQRTILIEDLKIENAGVDVASLSIPSQEVDGDFYAAMTVSPASFDLLVGDVMGKGLPGAFIAAAVRNQFLRVKLEKALLTSAGDVPETNDVVNEVSGKICPELIHLESFVTLVYARFDLDSRLFNFVDCGHTPIIHFREQTERCWLVKGRNLPLGFSEDELYVQLVLPFEENDIFFFYSDGISEARNQAGEFFGEKKIVAIIEENNAKSSAEIIGAVKNAVIDFCEGNSLADDFTCVCMKMQASASDEMLRWHGIFSGQISVLPNVRSFIRECLSGGEFDDLSPEAKEAIVLAGNEAASNVIGHGLAPEDESGFYMEIGKTKSWLFLRFIYAGKPFAWTQERKPRVESLQERGYGMFIMEQLMDSVIYANDFRGGIMMTLIKKFEKSWKTS